jgi:hypothetical protein
MVSPFIQLDVFKKKTLPAIQSTPKSVAFDIILDDSGVQSSQKGRLILPKIQVKTETKKQIMEHILAGAEVNNDSFRLYRSIIQDVV